MQVWTLSTDSRTTDTGAPGERAGRLLVFRDKPVDDHPLPGVVAGVITIGSARYLGIVVNGYGVGRGSTLSPESHVFLLYRLTRQDDGWRLAPSTERAAPLPRTFFPPRFRAFHGREIGTLAIGPDSTLITLGDAGAGELSVIVAHATPRGGLSLTYPLLDQISTPRRTSRGGRPAGTPPTLPNLTLLPGEIAREGTFGERNLLTFDREERQLLAQDPRSSTPGIAFQIAVRDLIPSAEGEQEVVWFSSPDAFTRWLPEALRALPTFRAVRLDESWVSVAPPPVAGEPAPYRAVMIPRFSESVPGLSDAIGLEIFRSLTVARRAGTGESVYYVRFPSLGGPPVSSWFRQLVMQLGTLTQPGARPGKKHLVFDLQRLSPEELEGIIGVLKIVADHCKANQLELVLLVSRETCMAELPDLRVELADIWRKLRTSALPLDTYLGDEVGVTLLLEELRRMPLAFERPDAAWVARFLGRLRAAQGGEPLQRIDRAARLLGLSLANQRIGVQGADREEAILDTYRRLAGGRRAPEFTARQVQQARGLRAHFSALSPSHGAVNFVGIDGVLDWFSHRLEAFLGYGSRHGENQLVITMMGDTGTGKTQLCESLPGYFDDAISDSLNLAELSSEIAARREARQRAARASEDEAAMSAAGVERGVGAELAEIIQAKADALYLSPRRLKFLILDEAHVAPELFPLLQAATGDLEADSAGLNLNGIITIVIMNNETRTVYRQLRGMPPGSPGSAALLTELFIGSITAERQQSLRAVAGRLIANMVLFPPMVEREEEIALLVDILVHSVARKHGANFFFDEGARRFLVDRVRMLGEAGNYRAAERAVESALALCFSDDPFTRTTTRDYVVRVGAGGTRLAYQEFRSTRDWIAFRTFHAVARLGVTSSRTLTGVLDSLEREAAFAGAGPQPAAAERNRVLVSRLRVELDRVWPTLLVGNDQPLAWIHGFASPTPIAWPASVGSANGAKIHEMLRKAARVLVASFYRAPDFASPLSGQTATQVTSQRERLLAELLFFVQIARQLTPELRPGGEFLTSPGTPVKEWQWAEDVITAGGRETSETGYRFVSTDTVHRSSRVAAELLRYYIAGAAHAFWLEETARFPDGDPGTGPTGSSACMNELVEQLMRAERRAQVVGLGGLPPFELR